MAEQEPKGQGEGSELATFGEDLRKEREIRGISLKEIADATKISRRFLDAIERNDHKTLPAPVFTRGFVREYARYVGLNAEELVNRYNYAAASDDRIEKPPQIEKYPQRPPRDISPKPVPKRGIPSPMARINANAVAIVVLIGALAAVAWWAVQQRRPDLEIVPVTTAVAPPSAARAVPPLTVVTETDDSTLQLVVEIVGDSWVTLEADGSTVLNAEMSAGDRRSFEAKESFRFRTIGNAAGVRLTLNGVKVPVLGGDGEVVKNRQFDREVLTRLRESEAPPVQTES